MSRVMDVSCFEAQNLDSQKLADQLLCMSGLKITFLQKTSKLKNLLTIASSACLQPDFS